MRQQTLRLFKLMHSRTSQHAFVQCATLCYMAVFAMLVYGVSINARVPTTQTAPAANNSGTRSVATAATSIAMPPCADIAGMGQPLCKAEARFEVAREKFRQRIAERKQNYRARKSAPVNVAAAPAKSVQVASTKIPDHVEQTVASLAVTE